MKKNIHNLNLFILIVLIGFLMHWQKHSRTKTIEANTIASKTVHVSTNGAMKAQVIFKK